MISIIQNFTYVLDTPYTATLLSQCMLTVTAAVATIHGWFCSDFREIPQRLQKFMHDKKVTTSSKNTLTEISQMVKKVPQYQKELNNFSTHMSLATDCMDMYEKRLKDICAVEQVSENQRRIYTLSLVKIKTENKFCRMVADPNKSQRHTLRLSLYLYELAIGFADPYTCRLFILVSSSLSELDRK